MDTFLSRPITCYTMLFSRSSIHSSKLPSFLCKHANVTACQYLSYSVEKYPVNTRQLTYCNVLTNQYVKNVKLNLCRTSVVHYSVSPKKESEEKPEKKNESTEENKPPVEGKPSLFARMKQMTKDYWPVLIPVHIITSLGWVSVFYVATKNGVDIVGMLESLNLSDRYLEMLRGSSAGHWAVTYALYKIFTPVRYTVTLGGTTMCIRYLNKWGYMKFKNSAQLVQSIKSGAEHRSRIGKECITSKANQTQSPKT